MLLQMNIHHKTPGVGIWGLGHIGIASYHTSYQDVADTLTREWDEPHTVIHTADDLAAMIARLEKRTYARVSLFDVNYNDWIMGIDDRESPPPPNHWPKP